MKAVFFAGHNLRTFSAQIANIVCDRQRRQQKRRTTPGSKRATIATTSHSEPPEKPPRATFREKKSDPPEPGHFLQLRPDSNELLRRASLHRCAAVRIPCEEDSTLEARDFAVTSCLRTAAIHPNPGGLRVKKWFHNTSARCHHNGIPHPPKTPGPQAALDVLTGWYPHARHMTRVAGAYFARRCRQWTRQPSRVTICPRGFWSVWNGSVSWSVRC